MTADELKKYKQPLPVTFSQIGIELVHEHIEDEYGVYETGFTSIKARISSSTRRVVCGICQLRQGIPSDTMN